MAGWLSLDGIVGRRFVLLFLGLAALSASVGRWSCRAVRGSGWPVLALLLGTGKRRVDRRLGNPRNTVGRGVTRSPSRRFSLRAHDGRGMAVCCGQHERRHESRTPATTCRIRSSASTSRTACTNVNIDRHRDWRFHDYDRAHRRRRRRRGAGSAALAVSSGVLTPLPGPARWHVDAVRPRYERMAGDSRVRGIGNLKALGVDRLFVSALSAYEIDYVAHDLGGFPVEDDWARTDPSAFTLLYENPQVKVYAVHAPWTPHGIDFLRSFWYDTGVSPMPSGPVPLKSGRSLSIVIPAYCEREEHPPYFGERDACAAAARHRARDSGGRRWQHGWHG